MSISATRPAPVHATDQTIVPPNADGRRITPPPRHAPFVRKPSPAVGAYPPGPAPPRPLATALCQTCAGLRQQLESGRATHPTYVGSHHGSWIYSDPETGQAGVRNLDLDRGPGLADFGSTCLLKPDGRIVFNGETLTAGHPDLPDVEKALGELLRAASRGGMKREGVVAGKPLQPPWDPGARTHPHFVP